MVLDVDAKEVKHFFNIFFNFSLVSRFSRIIDGERI
jgi:hypothetical protein